MSLPIWVMGLALLPLVVGLVNLAILRSPSLAARTHRVSVLIPARNEEGRIGPALASVLASEGVELEVIVGDDHSTDGTAAQVAALARSDPRVRLFSVPALPPGWSGKQHACAQLAAQAAHATLVFLDADVRLHPDLLARLAEHLDTRRAALVTGFPFQQTGSMAEKLIVPLMHWLLLGYWPGFFARLFRFSAFGAGCGQVMACKKDAYQRAGGHAAIRESMHDGIRLPRRFRKAGFFTELVDLNTLAQCRMYDSWEEVWWGFGKNAREGMATPIALPIWTVLLAGGHLAPWAGLLFAPSNVFFWIAGAASIGFRLLLALRFGQSLTGALLHPLGVLLLLALQWQALLFGLGGTGRWAKRVQAH